MAGVKFSVAVEGVDRLVREMRLAKPHIQERVKKTIQRHTSAVASKAEAIAPKRSGELASTVRAEYANDGLVGMVKTGYGKLVRRSRATTDRGRERALKVRQQRDARKLQLALANTSRQALGVADLGVYAPVVNWGDQRRGKPARHFLVGDPSAPFDAERPAAVADIQRDLVATVDEMGDGR